MRRSPHLRRTPHRMRAARPTAHGKPSSTLNPKINSAGRYAGRREAGLTNRTGRTLARRHNRGSALARSANGLVDAEVQGEIHALVEQRITGRLDRQIRSPTRLLLYVGDRRKRKSRARGCTGAEAAPDSIWRLMRRLSRPRRSGHKAASEPFVPADAHVSSPGAASFSIPNLIAQLGVSSCLCAVRRDRGRGEPMLLVADHREVAVVLAGDLTAIDGRRFELVFRLVRSRRWISREALRPCFENQVERCLRGPAQAAEAALGDDVAQPRLSCLGA
jgi:hypothetical protein